ncbi:MAG TPA: septum formation protein Maf [Candidatus Latescibacteria bacterium]|nr:septum formation protein Maf [Candidatus Latescibacterota bacterium]
MGLPDGDRRRNPIVVLASASPRRADLLRQLGVPFERVVSPEGEQLPPSGSGVGDYAVGAARVKARAVHDLVVEEGGAVPRGHRFVVVGADTVVCEGGAVLGKPSGPEEATDMLRRLSGRTHHVYTGLVVVGPGEAREQSGCEVTEVSMRALSAADIACYVACGEPLDKAGAYGIQGRGGRFIERISGCYYNVVGLPLARLSAMLESAGFDFTTRG